MEDARTRWILCGGANSQLASGDVLRLAIRRDGVLKDGQFRIELGGVEKQLLGMIPDLYNDLIEIAAYVHVADQAMFRGDPNRDDTGTAWHRQFHFVVPVRRVDFWQSTEVKRSVESLLRFLSDDGFQFSFEPLQRQHDHQLVLSAGGEQRSLADWRDIKSVILFSGGLDSLTGAYEELVERRNDAILVSHSSATKMIPARNKLVGALRERAHGLGRTHISVAVERVRAGHDRERTQRTRSFLFAAIAGAVAHVANCQRIRFYENGIVALNLPVTANSLGARATRTVHPHVLKRLSELLSLIDGQNVLVENPFVDFTRTEVMGRLRDMGGKDLFPFTRSCADTIGATTAQPHCGVCSQCVDRRMAAVAANLHDLEPDDLYRKGGFKESIADNCDRLFLSGYVQSASAWADIRSVSEFVSRFREARGYGELTAALPALAKVWGCSIDSALERVVDLYRRQGLAVINAIGTLLRDNMLDFLQGRLAPDSMLMTLSAEAVARSGGLRGDDLSSAPLVAPPESRPLAPIQPAPATPSPQIVELSQPLKANVFIRKGKFYLIGLKGSPGILMPDSKATGLLAYLIGHAGDSISPLVLDAAAEGKTPPESDSESAVEERVTKRDITRIRDGIKTLESERAEQEACGDTSAVWDTTQRIQQMEDWLSRNTWHGRPKMDATPAVQQARDRLRRAIARFLGELRSESTQIADYFEKHVKAGTSFCFSDLDTDWKL